MSYQPFIDGPGRVNDYVKLNGTIWKILHVEDVFTPTIGWNAAATQWDTEHTDRLAVRGDTGFQNVPLTNIAQHRLLQITGIDMRTVGIELRLRQPAKMTRWGAGNVPEGAISVLNSPIGSPIRLRNLFTVNEKPIQMRGLSLMRATRVCPLIYMRGFLYELAEGPKTVRVYYEPPIGGIE